MDVDSRRGLPVGIVRWQAPRPTLTVVVKATFRLDATGAAILSAQQEPLWGDEVGELGTEEELERASDFAPRKARADILVVGHAHSAEPQSSFAVSFAVDGIRKRFVAGAGVPSTAIPLLSEYLRPVDGGGLVRVAPRPQGVAAWSTRALAASFDFGAFNVAPSDQQLAALSPRARISLQGLLPGAPIHEVELPGFAPAAFVVRSRAGDDVDEVELVCDTLWICADRALCTLSWRGSVAQPAAESYLVVDAAHGRAPSWSELVSSLGSAGWMRAVEDPTQPRAPASEAALTIREADEWDESTVRIGGHDETAPPDGAGGFVVPPALAALGKLTETTAVSEGAPHEGAPLPFRPVAPALVASPFEPDAYRDETLVASPAAPREPLPFRGARPPPPPALLPARAPRDLGAWDEQTQVPMAPAGGPPLPFPAPLGRPAGASTAPNALPEGALSLERYATIKVALLSGVPLATVLERHGIDELAWRTEERRRTQELSRAAERGELSIVHAMRQALRDAQGRK